MSTPKHETQRPEAVTAAESFAELVAAMNDHGPDSPQTVMTKLTEHHERFGTETR